MNNKDADNTLAPVTKTIQDIVYEQWMKANNAPCLILGNKTYTYGKIVSEALKFSDGLKNHPNFNVGDHVAIVLSPPNIPHFVISFLGILFAGGVPVHVNIKDWNSNILTAVLKDCNARIVVTIGTVLPSDKRGKRVLDLSHVTDAISSGNTKVKSVILIDLRDIVPKNDRKKRLGLTALWWQSTPFWRALRHMKISVIRWDNFINHIPELRISAHPAKSNDVAVLLYTSGTSGGIHKIPKAVPLTHKNILSNISQCAAVVDPHLEDLPPDKRVIVAALPFYHAFGLTPALLYPLTHGYPVVLVPKPQDRGTLLRALTQHKAVVYLGTPPFFFRKPVTDANKQTFDNLALRIAISGSEKIRQQEADDFEQTFGVFPIQGYGSTEGSPVITLSEVGSRNLESVGRALPDTDILLANPNSASERLLIPASTQQNGDKKGLLLIRGPQIMSGYSNQPKEKQPFVLVSGYEGKWLNSGDIVHMDNNNEVYIDGRLDRQFKENGEIRIPENLEREIENHPDIDVAIVVPKDFNGQTGICVGVILHRGKKIDHITLVDWCTENDIRPPWETIVIPQETRDEIVHLSGKKLYGAFIERFAQKNSPNEE